MTYEKFIATWEAPAKRFAQWVVNSQAYTKAVVAGRITFGLSINSRQKVKDDPLVDLGTTLYRWLVDKAVTGTQQSATLEDKAKMTDCMMHVVNILSAAFHGSISITHMDWRGLPKRKVETEWPASEDESFTSKDGTWVQLMVTFH